MRAMPMGLRSRMTVVRQMRSAQLQSWQRMGSLRTQGVCLPNLRALSGEATFLALAIAACKLGAILLMPATNTTRSWP